MEDTIEPGVYVESRAPGRIVFWDSRTGERWAQLGVCDCSGLCEHGATPHPSQQVVWLGSVGTPGACRDLNYGRRPEIPTRPEWREASRRMAQALECPVTECGFYFEWLEPRT